MKSLPFSLHKISLWFEFYYSDHTKQLFTKKYNKLCTSSIIRTEKKNIEHKKFTHVFAKCMIWLSKLITFKFFSCMSYVKWMDMETGQFFILFCLLIFFLTENLRRSTDRDEVVIPIGNRFDKQVLFGKMIDESLVFVEQTV